MKKNAVRLLSLVLAANLMFVSYVPAAEQPESELYAEDSIDIDSENVFSEFVEAEDTDSYEAEDAETYEAEDADTVNPEDTDTVESETEPIGEQAAEENRSDRVEEQLSAAPAALSSAAEGACGLNVQWSLDDDGVLTIIGDGSMWDYGPGTSPWYSDRRRINTIYVDSGVTYLGSCAFYNCTSLYDVVLPDGTEAIGERAFEGCTDLTEIALPSSMLFLGDRAFFGCRSLTDLDLPQSIEHMGNEVFCGCSGLTDITLPENVISIGSSAFSGCSSLKRVTVPDGVTEIGNSAFSDCENLEEVIFPDGIVSLGSFTFAYCSKLRQINIPEGVTAIGTAVFIGCESLAEITLPEGMTEIGEEAFAECTALESVTIPASMSVIGTAAFDQNGSLSDVWYGGSRAEWDSISVSERNEPLTGAVIHCVETVIPVTAITLNKSASTLFSSGNSLTLKASVLPEDASDKSVEWKSSNPKAATVDENGVVTGVGKGTAEIKAVSASDESVYAVCRVTVKMPSIVYQAKVLGRSGWDTSVKDKATAGTTGQSLIMEAMRVKITGDSGTGAKLSLQYRVHMQTTGWTGWMNSWNTGGIVNGRKRMEAVQIRLTGADADKYDLYYCLHVQNFGWLNWAKASGSVGFSGYVSQASGSSGLSRRVEAFRMVLLPKGSSASKNLGSWSSCYVKGVAVKSLKTSVSSLTLKVGKTGTVGLTVSPDNATFRKYNQYWTSSNTSVATVTNKGVVTAKKKGTCTITVKSVDGRAVTKFKVTVK